MDTATATIEITAHPVQLDNRAQPAMMEIREQTVKRVHLEHQAKAMGTIVLSLPDVVAALLDLKEIEVILVPQVQVE